MFDRLRSIYIMFGDSLTATSVAKSEPIDGDGQSNFMQGSKYYIFGSVERSKSSCEMFDLSTCLSRPSLHFEFLSSPVRPTFPIYVSYISTQKTNQILVFQESEPIVFSQLDLDVLRIACSA